MQHFMDVLDVTGHTKVTWNKNDPAEVKAARDTFTEMTSKGYRAFKPGKDGEQIDRFNPKLERIVLVPQLHGG